MIKIQYTNPVDLEDVSFYLRLESKSPDLPDSVLTAIETLWNDFSSKTEAKTGRAPGKNGIIVLGEHRLLPDGLDGLCSLSPFDQVLYFARSEIPQDHYNIGRTKVGFPLASWAVICSSDNNLILARKSGAEGAYVDSPYSAFGGLVSASQDMSDSQFQPVDHLRRATGTEIGNPLWERVSTVRYVGFNSYDANSSRINNGYDTVWQVNIDADTSEVLRLLGDSPQFLTKSAANIVAEPRDIGRFLMEHKTTASGMAGLLCYTGAFFGEEGLKDIDLKQAIPTQCNSMPLMIRYQGI